ncbi:MAG: putative transrane acyltransferase [Frankiales bacterium]|nr:putative transrane acyltransferase [Frankiales bacterium]
MIEEKSRSAPLDGLRALAVTAVLLFHGGVSWAQGGFLGVDLFFVLSGFLITGLLLSEYRHRDRISLRHFWARRARRLLPALLVMVAGVVATIAWHTSEGISSRLRGDVIATLGDFANWRLAAHGDNYFALQDDPSPLDHTWSLAIEAQFYLVWPLLVIAALAVARRRRWLVMVLALLGTVGSVAVAALAVGGGAAPTSLYYRTDIRAEALLVGSLLAVVLAYRPEPAQPGRLARAALGLLGAVGLVAIAWLWHAARGDSPWLYQGGLLGAAVASAALVAAVTLHPGGPLGRLLGSPLPRGIGRISYGIYLWHWPVYLALTPERIHLHGPALLGARLFLTLELAGLSWLLVEQPVRRVKRMSLVLVPTGLVVSLTATTLFVYGIVAPAQPRLATTAALSAEPHSLPTPLPRARPVVRPVVATPTQVRRTPHVVAPAPRVPPPPPVPQRPAVPVDLLGDSVAESLGHGLQEADTTYGANVINRGVIGCGIATTPQYRFRGEIYGLADQCAAWEQQYVSSLKRDHPKVVLLVLGRHEVWDGNLDNRWTNVGQADFDHYLAGQLDRAITLASSTGARVAMTTVPYFHGPSRPDGGQYPENDPKRVDRFNVLVRQAVARHAKQAFVIDLNHKACPRGVYTSTVDGVKLRKDGVHFTEAGGRWLAPWLIPQLVH